MRTIAPGELLSVLALVTACSVGACVDASASCGGQPSAAAEDASSTDPFFAAQMRAARVPGIAVALIGGGRIKWAKGYGLANIAEKRPVTPDTLFMIASTSKAVTAVALMQLIEDPARGLDLDQDVDANLPFTVRNPSFPDTPITYRMLLTHTSGLIDSQDGYWDIEEPTPLHAGDSPIQLLDFQRGYVARAAAGRARSRAARTSTRTPEPRFSGCSSSGARGRACRTIRRRPSSIASA
jgi:CubicO group peptidase (beta-lactamase class C family)